jgi:radical SAM superfamily enzyme YgiQ (UPF0313 family)
MRILLVVYDNDSYIHWFPQGTAYIAAALRNAGHEVTIYQQDVHHWPETHLTNYLDANKFDGVGVGVIGGYYQFAKLLKIADAINKSKHRPFFVLGGHGPSPEPEYFLKRTGADAVLMGEGERIVATLFEQQQRGMYKGSGQADVDTLPMPAYDLFPIEYYRLMRMPKCKNADFVMPVLSGRGCPFKCNFCYRMEKGFRARNVDAIVAEVKLLQNRYGVTYVAFSDELLMSSVERTEQMCRALKPLGVRWECNGRLNYAEKNLLELMRDAGCVFVNYGIEAVDDRSLRMMNKALTVGQITRGIENTLEAGLSPGFNIIWGNLGDTLETLENGVKFLLKYDDGAQLRTIRPVTPYPGSPLFAEAVKRGALGGVADFYESKHVNSDLASVQFTGLSDFEFHAALCRANKRLLRNYYLKQHGRAVEQTEKLYAGDTGFRGYRQT